MQTITHTVRIDSNNHGQTAENPAPALVMGQATEYAINLIDANNQPFNPPNIGGVEEWRFVLAGDFNQSTPNCLTTSARYAGQGWFFADVSESWTAEMVSYLGGAEYKPIQAEIIGIGSAGETKDDWVFQFSTYIRNRVDAIGHDAPSAVTPYITSADLEQERATYLEPILSGVESVSGIVSNSSYGNEGLLNQLRSTHTTLSNKATDIYDRISNTMTGLPIIQYHSERAANTVNNANHGNAAIKATVDTLATSAQATGIQATLDDSYHGLSTIRAIVGTNYDYLSNENYGLPAIKAALGNAPALTRAQMLNVIQNRSLAAVPVESTAISVPFDMETQPGLYAFVNWASTSLKVSLALPIRSITMGTGFFQNTTGVELFKLTQTAAGGYGVTLPSFQNSDFRKVWIQQTGAASTGPFSMGGGMFNNCGNLVAIRMVGVVNPFGAQLGSLPNLEYIDAADSSGYTSTSQNFVATTANYYPKLKVIRAANVTQFSNNCFLACPNLQIVDMRSRTLTTVPTLTLNAVTAFHGLKFVIPDSLWSSWAEATSGNWYNARNAGYVTFEKASEYTGDDYSNYDWEGLDTL